MTGPAPRRLAGYGLAVRLPDRWEGRIYQRANSVPAAPAGPPSAVPATASVSPAAAGSSALATGSSALAAGSSALAARSVASWQDERTHPVLHLANFALPGSRGDFGTGAVERMGSGHVFIAVLQFGADCLGSALYAPQGFPRLAARDFNPNGLQRRVAGQAGFQHFCTVADRPLCLYVVLGAHRQAAALCPEINDVIERIEVSQ
jgi:X-X-X-Leu-X-X-Gly heptad repeat protein